MISLSRPVGLVSDCHYHYGVVFVSYVCGVFSMVHNVKFKLYLKGTKDVPYFAAIHLLVLCYELVFC